MTEITLIAALGQRGELGFKGELVWRQKEDLQHFKRLTLGHPILMGRKTWDSLGRALPGRLNVVLTRQPDWAPPDGVLKADSLQHALALTSTAARVFIIGGGELYAQALPLAHTLILTEVQAEFEADVFFPPFDRANFIEQSRQTFVNVAGITYAFLTYTRNIP